MVRRYPRYESDSDYNTNAPDFYEFLSRMQKLVKELSERIWGYDKVLASKLKEIDDRLQYYMDEWDERLKKFPDNVEKLLVEWLSDGTLDDIINVNIFADLNKKIDNVEKNFTKELATYKREVDQIGTTIFIRK